MKKNNPKISVIVPCYNAEKYLVPCMDSIVNQTFRDIEIIAVNDGAKDSTLEILRSYEEKDNRVKVLDLPNGGYGRAVNSGIKEAKGDYIGIVESDDYIVEYMYEKLYMLTENGTVDMVKGNFWDCYDEKDGSITKVLNQERHNMPDVEEAFTVREHPEILWGHPSIWTGIYRRDFLKKNGIVFKEAKGGGWVDNPFFFDTLCCAQSIRWTKEPFYCYRKTNSESSSVGYDLALPFERMMDNLAVLRKRNVNDEVILNFAYARALMYLCGAMAEKHYAKNVDYARPYMQKMLSEINPDVITQNFHLGDQKNYWKYLSPLTTLMPQNSKILIYNWVPFDNPGGVGGGVTIYCKNLIQEILRERPDVQVYFLSCGWAYDISVDKCYVRKIENIFGERCRSFEIVNSPVPAAQNILLNNPSVAFENEMLKKQIEEFIREYGPFSNIHFNNMEGLSFDVFDLKKEFPETKFIYSIHNYAPFCMTGFYYQRHNHCNCSPNHTPEDCLKCTNVNRQLHMRKEMSNRGKVNVSNRDQYDEFKWIETFGFDKLDDIAEKETFVEFANRATDSLNRNMDVILAVSERVREIAVDSGIDSKKVITNYIGTKIADFQVRQSTAQKGDYLKVCFLGNLYGYEEKGYPFLMEALGHLDRSYASRIDLVLTTKDGNEEEMRNKLSHFHSVNIIRGYSHKDLNWILKGVHLGVIPVMWEDNLPQIAIEMVAHGVPVLCSSFGGASELCDSELFRFEGGNEEDFLKKLIYLLKNPEKIHEYWKHHKGLTTMKMHFAELSNVYALPEKAVATVTLEDYSKLLDENEFLYKHFESNNERQDLRRELANKDRYIHEVVEERDRRVHEVEEVTNRRIQELAEDRDRLLYELTETRNSMTYKIGRALTLIPRKMRGDK